ncbi:SDR family oxidoreductase [Sinorhizobium alkalisoli]|uniref:Short-chain dehydrogenase n=1 Tax=Sinorhizobium alkalisoli TaxID=1752398 RepID=A0A1E3VHD8_9HYPH|nr:SDR family oxidoreductase [Sinorhizobium alkalisoli]ODR92954.1 short-chain dehydrogenase [Sinorhizobium alkalisoli]
MDLGIKGKRALVCAGSKGLGRGVAEKLAEAGVILTLNAREQKQLRETARAISETYGTQVEIVAADVTTEEGRNALLRQEPKPDILITNAGGPPPGDWSSVTEANWQEAIRSNMLAPILLMKAVLPGMIARKWGRIVNITSASVKSPIPQLCLSNGARSGLTGFVAGTARQVARHGVVINNLLPGSHDTERLEKLLEKTAKARGISLDEARAEEYAHNPTGRVGTPEEFGAAAAFLCSQYAGYIVGQNLLIDGGAFNSTF